MPKTPMHSHKPGKEPKPGRCPPFEEAVRFYIEDGEAQKRALDFAAWLRKNKLSPVTGTNGYNWYINFKYTDCTHSREGACYRGTYHGCYLKLFGGTWHLLPSKDILERVLAREELKEVVWESVFPCHGCNYGCFKHTHATESTIELFGRVFQGRGVCRHNPICFTAPDEKTLAVCKEILLDRKESTDLRIQDGTIYSYGML